MSSIRTEQVVYCRDYVIELCEKGFVKIPFPLPFGEYPQAGHNVQDLEIWYRNFLHMNRQDPKWCVDFENDGDPDDGLIEKENPEGGDIKVCFHWRPRLHAIAAERGWTNVYDNEIFLRLSSEIFNRSQKTIIHVSQAIDHWCGFKNSFVDSLQACLQKWDSCLS